MQLASARHSLEVQTISLDAIERLQRAGRGTALDVTRACGQLQQLQANLPPFQAQQRTALYRLAALTGRTPAQIPASLLHATAPRLTQTIPVGDGAALLRRRPDIRQAERSLAAATARIGGPRPTCTPKISLGLSGASGGPAAMPGDRGTFSWSIGPLISWTIPNTGAAQARIAQAEAGTKAAAARFDAAVLNALRETESADRLCAPARPRKRAASRARAERPGRQPARQLFQYGKTDYLTVLDAERTLAANESSAGGGPPNSAATRSPCSWRWAAAGRTGRTRPPALSPPSTPAGAKIGRFRLIPPPAGASLQAFRLHGRPAALPLFPAPAARLHCIAGRLLQHAQPAKPPERVTGAGGSMLRYSSKQTTIELTPAERAAVDQVRVRAYPASDAAQLRDACGGLKAAGYEQVAGDAATDIVTGERHQKLVGRSREALRGCPSQGLAYGAKPDHQSTYAQLVIRRDGAQARLDRPEQHDLGQQWRRQEPRRHRRRRLPGPVRAPGPGAEDARAPGAQPRKPQLPAAAVCITGYIRAPPAPARLVSTRPAHAPASCLVLYGSYR